MYISELKKRLEKSTGFDAIMGFEIKEIGQEGFVLSLPVTTNKLNMNGTLHGGVYATLLDIVIGLSIREQVNDPLVTLNLNTSYFSPAFEGEKVVASAKILHLGYKLVSGEGEIKNSEGTLLAKATGIFKVIRS